MNVLLTGATGFVGWSLAELLLAEGHAVRCLVRSPSRAAALGAQGAAIVRGDVGSGEGVEEAVRGIEGVVHAAGVIRAWTEAEYYRTNAEGTRILALRAREAGARRFLLVSSLAATGPRRSADAAAADGDAVGAEGDVLGAGAHAVVTEESPPRPINAYGRSKLAGERALAEVAGDMEWTVVRPAAVYGPRDRDFLALFRLVARGLGIHAAARDARITLIHVEDLARLILVAFQEGRSGRAYLGSDGVARTWPEIIAAVAAALSRKVRPLRIPPWTLQPIAAAGLLLRPFLARPPILCPSKLREAATPSWVASPARARAELAWAPRVGLEEGMRRTAQWYRNEGWL